MGEVDELQDAVDHGVAQGNQGIDATEHQASEDLLEQDFHGLLKTKGLCLLDRDLFNTDELKDLV
jgi:hypothetical protein